jgi:hypothetical protein
MIDLDTLFDAVSLERAIFESRLGYSVTTAVQPCND